MNQRLATIQVYNFDQLEEKGKDRVRYWLSDGGIFEDSVSDLLASELDGRGLKSLVNDRSPAWSLYDQGSGVSFEGGFDLDQFRAIDGPPEATKMDIAAVREIFTTLAGTLTTTKDYYVAVTRTELHYTHSRSFTTTVSFQWNSDEDVDPDAIDKLETTLSETVGDYLERLSTYLCRLAEAEYDYQLSDEALTELCRSNEYLFNVYGEPVHHLIVD